MFDTARLAAIVSEKLGTKCRVEPLVVKCTYPVFKGIAEGGGNFFVKLGEMEEWRRTAALLEQVGGGGLFAALMIREPVVFDGKALFVSEWKGAQTVFPEEMTEDQIEGFVAGCKDLSRTLRTVSGYEPVAGSQLDPEVLHRVIVEYAKRHRFAARAFRDLVELPQEKRSYRGRRLTVVHGDFHAKNFGFEGNRMSVVYDFDKLTEGLGCGDFVNAIGERFSLLSMGREARERLRIAASAAFSAAPWPKDEMEIAINVLRMVFAARRLKKHPNAPWVALDVRRRDNRIKEMLGCLGK